MKLNGLKFPLSTKKDMADTENSSIRPACFYLLANFTDTALVEYFCRPFVMFLTFYLLVIPPVISVSTKMNLNDDTAENIPRN